MSNLINEENDVDQNLSHTEEIKNSSKMFLYLRELFFLFALVFTSYTALFSSLPKIGKAPIPIPFFPQHSVVSDYYKGTVTTAFQRASEVDITVIMYYAPWDAESQAARQEFEDAAEFLQDEVFFTAISCWSPGSECKQHIPRIRHFPVIVVYPQHSKGVRYQGPLKSVFIINFIKTVMRPIKRITSASDIIDLTSRYNVLLVGSFLFMGNLGGPGYYIFYSAALKILEKDPFTEIGFAVTTNSEVAAALEIDAVPNVRLYLWNETFDYPSDVDYTEESLMKWMWQKNYQVVKWVSPPMMKSLTLSHYISRGPALILFTPRNPLQKENLMFDMLKEIAYRYHNCNNSFWVKHLANYIDSRNRNFHQTQQKLENYCTLKKRKSELYNKSIYLPSVIVPDSFTNSSENIGQGVCDVGGSNSEYLGPEMEVCFRRSKASSVLMKNLHFSNSPRSSIFTGRVDINSAEYLLDMWEEDKCNVFDSGNQYYRLPSPKLEKNKLNFSIDGLACVNNKTLSIIAMDSMFYYQFAEGLGINILHSKTRSAVAIIDRKEDSQYVLESEITRNNLISFILKHTQSKLNRFLRSSANSELRSLTRHRYPVRKGENCTHTETESCVPELNSDNFLEYVLNRNKAVIVFYHTPYCALCRSISHLFLLLSRYFRHFPGLKFARIDGDNNDLPWEYTMDLFPSILFFPTLQKSESRLYSNDLPFTLKNLIHFVLANLEAEAKIPAMVSLCLSFQKLQNDNEARKCKSKIQKESYHYLSLALQDMRKVISRWKNLPPTSKFISEIRKRKELLLLKLEYFKTSHLLLGSLDKLKRDSGVVTDIIKLYLKFLRLIRSNSYYLNYDGFR